MGSERQDDACLSLELLHRQQQSYVKELESVRSSVAQVRRIVCGQKLQGMLTRIEEGRCSVEAGSALSMSMNSVTTEGSAGTNDTLLIRLDALESSNQCLRDQILQVQEISSRERHASSAARQELQERNDHLRKVEAEFVAGLKIIETGTAQRLDESDARFVKFKEDHTGVMVELRSRIDRSGEAVKARLQSMEELRAEVAARLEASEVKLRTICREYVAEGLREVTANLEDMHQRISEVQQDKALETVELRARLEASIGDFDQEFAKLEARSEAHRTEFNDERSCRLAEAESIRSKVELLQTQLETSELRRQTVDDRVAGTEATKKEDDRGAELKASDFECLAIRLASLEQKIALVGAASVPQREARSGGGQEQASGAVDVAEVRAALAETCDGLVRLAKDVAKIREECSSDKNNAIDIASTVARAAALSIQRAEQKFQADLEARRNDSDSSIRQAQQQFGDLAFNAESINQRLKAMEADYRDLTGAARKSMRPSEDSTRQLRTEIRKELDRTRVDLETTLEQKVKASVTEDFVEQNRVIEKVSLRIGALEGTTRETTHKLELAKLEMLELCKETASSTAAGVARKTVEAQRMMFNVADLRSALYNVSENVSRLSRDMHGLRASPVAPAAASDTARSIASTDTDLDNSRGREAASQSSQTDGVSPRNGRGTPRRHSPAALSSRNVLDQDVMLGNFVTAKFNEMPEESPGSQLRGVSAMFAQAGDSSRPMGSPRLRQVSPSSPKGGPVMKAAITAAGMQRPPTDGVPNSYVGPSVKDSNMSHASVQSGESSSVEEPSLHADSSRRADNPVATSGTRSTPVSALRPQTGVSINGARHIGQSRPSVSPGKESAMSARVVETERFKSSSPLRSNGTRYVDMGNLAQTQKIVRNLSPRIVYGARQRVGPMPQNEAQARPAVHRFISEDSRLSTAQTGAGLNESVTPRSRPANPTNVEQPMIGCVSPTTQNRTGVRVATTPVPKPVFHGGSYSPNVAGERRESIPHNFAVRQDASRGGSFSARAGDQTPVPRAPAGGSVSAPVGRYAVDTKTVVSSLSPSGR